MFSLDNQLTGIARNAGQSTQLYLGSTSFLQITFPRDDVYLLTRQGLQPAGNMVTCGDLGAHSPMNAEKIYTYILRPSGTNSTVKMRHISIGQL